MSFSFQASKISRDNSKLDFSPLAAEAMDFPDPFENIEDNFGLSSCHFNFEVWEQNDESTELEPKSDNEYTENAMSCVPQPEILTRLGNDATFNPSAVQECSSSFSVSLPDNVNREEHAWIDLVMVDDEATLDAGNSLTSVTQPLSTQKEDEDATGTELLEQDSEKGESHTHVESEAGETSTYTEEEEDAVSAAARRARRGQTYWSKELSRTKAEWRRLRIDELYPELQTKLKHSSKTFRSQKVCTLMKLHVAAVLGIISLKLDDSTFEIKGFLIVQGRDQEFRQYFDPGLTYKSFCSIFRRAGFLPDGRAWEAAFRGEAWLHQVPGKVSSTEL